ncbi:amine oxidase [Methylobacterium indicum]|uniref:flavin monoamine oxidase family protein n=1 Tax=Methylobacterium indicum TaxID=1775910 RepID=UPI0007346233|nr:amine oxidase [Methylobacterium indicum]KTS39758.1 amine oxidase [Methylobacterium indicum]KTS52638.1 amine oxidase [Methylobacterium indicum]
MPRAAHQHLPPTGVPPLADLPASPDVAVIGAGAAGIGAARRLRALGLSVAVLEARPRLGGRTVTTALRGHPVDLGAHWLHAGPINPLVALGLARGEPLRRAAQESHLWVGRRPGRPAEEAAFGRAWSVADRAMTDGARLPGADRPASTALPPGLGPWGKRVSLVHGLVSGRPLSEISLHDFPSMEYGDNFFIAGGYGAYLARLAAGLPVALGTPVTALDWAGEGVSLDLGARGTLRARAALVTAPMMVLQEPAPALRFAPDLPGPVRAAIEGFATGIYEHVVLHWPSSPFRGRDRLASLIGGRCQPPGLLTRVDGTPFHYFELDVPMAARLDAARAGADGARRMVRESLAEQVGRGSLRDLAVPAVTEWRHDPWSRGSWAVVPPGHTGARDLLKEAVGERIWFAGEALSREQWGTAGGAFAEGERAADAIAGALGRSML